MTGPVRRLRECVDAWPEASEGSYDPKCCRWPKSCSATVYDPATVTDSDLEPAPPATEERTVTAWNLNLTEQTETVLRTIAALDTSDPAVMAATLRAIADRLDPPQPVRPAYRRGDLRNAIEATARRPRATLADEPDPVVVSTTGGRMDAPDAVLHPAAEAVAREAADLGRARGRITNDGCGPVHTHTGSCAYASGPQGA